MEIPNNSHWVTFSIIYLWGKRAGGRRRKVFSNVLPFSMNVMNKTLWKCVKVGSFHLFVDSFILSPSHYRHPRFSPHFNQFSKEEKNVIFDIWIINQLDLTMEAGIFQSTHEKSCERDEVWLERKRTFHVIVRKKASLKKLSFGNLDMKFYYKNPLRCMMITWKALMRKIHLLVRIFPTAKEGRRELFLFEHQHKPTARQ